MKKITRSKKATKDQLFLNKNLITLKELSKTKVIKQPWQRQN